MAIELSFLGATDNVTGSRYLVKTGGALNTTPAATKRRGRRPRANRAGLGACAWGGGRRGQSPRGSGVEGQA